MRKIEALGVIETQYFTYALELLDEMVKVANVQFLSSEKYLGGRLVTVIVGGGVSDVKTAVQAAKEKALRNNRPLKVTLTIPNPHDEILKFVVPNEKEKSKSTFKNNKNNKKTMSKKNGQKNEIKTDTVKNYSDKNIN